MKKYSIHIATWQLERRNMLPAGYCFGTSINNVQDKPSTGLNEEEW